MKPRLNNHVFLPRLRRRAFTLTELLVVISVIALVLSITLPGIVGLFTAGSDVQGRNVISGIFGAARGVAIENQSYAAVHVQIGTDEKCWAAVLKYDNDPTSASYEKFVPVAGFPPCQMPGDIAFGEITPTYVTGSNYQTTMNDDAGLTNFTTFNVIFGPDGSLTKLVNGALPQIETGKEVKIFGGDGVTAKQQIWDATGVTINEQGVRAITAFHYKTLVSVSSRSAWLEKNGQFLCMNPYTGKLLPTK